MKIVILLSTLLLCSGCSTISPNKNVYKKKLNYNHRPYIKLKYNRELKRLSYE
jgi:uncharacterized protein YceK